MKYFFLTVFFHFLCVATSFALTPQQHKIISTVSNQLIKRENKNDDINPSQLVQMVERLVWETEYSDNQKGILYTLIGELRTHYKLQRIPKSGTKWQRDLSDNPDILHDVDVYDIDLFETSRKTIEELHLDGKKVICYLSAGSVENWREDAIFFPSDVVGNDYDGWEGEKWLDVRRIDLIGSILEKRLDLAVEKGCDAIEPDNIEAYTINSGFPLTYADQLKFNIRLAEQVHRRGMSIGLKNDGEQVLDLLDMYDFAVVEECFQYESCADFFPFIQNNKAVLGVEYHLHKDKFCTQANNRKFSRLKMPNDLQLDGYFNPCRDE